ncbi:SCO family protein [Pseudoalteromonas mariniglutinosa]|uniref:SCO family protein n=1 Tax=Pseudoalteromonas mariniglutinosa TaxID=206042 RepID=UPI00384FB46B
MRHFGLALVFLFTLLLTACGGERSLSDVSALIYKSAKPLSDFTLNDQHGNVVTKQALLGQWNLVFLGYTSCPDICPLTLAKLNSVHNSLKDNYPVQIWFLAVDPKRDTVAKRKQYIDYFNPSFLAVSGEHKHLFPLVRELGLIYAIADSDQQEYAVDHSASVALVDPQGAVRAIFKPEFKQGNVPLINAKTLSKEFQLIADYYTQ